MKLSNRSKAIHHKLEHYMIFKPISPFAHFLSVRLNTVLSRLTRRGQPKSASSTKTRTPPNIDMTAGADQISPKALVRVKQAERERCKQIMAAGIDANVPHFAATLAFDTEMPTATAFKRIQDVSAEARTGRRTRGALPSVALASTVDVSHNTKRSHE
ncbi:MAG: hypothetical protein QM749_03460 [Aquabacterium sp.]